MNMNQKVSRNFRDILKPIPASCWKMLLHTISRYKSPQSETSFLSFNMFQPSKKNSQSKKKLWKVASDHLSNEIVVQLGELCILNQGWLKSRPLIWKVVVKILQDCSCCSWCSWLIGLDHRFLVWPGSPRRSLHQSYNVICKIEELGVVENQLFGEWLVKSAMARHGSEPGSFSCQQHPTTKPVQCWACCQLALSQPREPMKHIRNISERLRDVTVGLQYQAHAGRMEDN